jgi:hypothetical protein
MATAFDIIVDVTYDMCVFELMELAKYTGLSYREVNFVVFMIVIPAIFFILFMTAVIQAFYIRHLKKTING